MNSLRIIISVIAVSITGKVSFSTRGTVSNAEWFVTMGMFLASYVPDILIGEETLRLNIVRWVQIIITFILGVISFCGLSDILCIVSEENIVYLRTGVNFIISDVSLGRLVYWWIPVLFLEVGIIIRYLVTPSSIQAAINYDKKFGNRKA